MDNKSQLEEAIFAAIEAGKKITVKWDCGGDEAIIKVLVDGAELTYNNAFAMELDMYLVNYLNLPDAGEFSMTGNGEIVEENEELYIVYESILKGVEDYETGRWKELNEKDDVYSGKKKLFQ
ncbi:MAG: hypothetical protein KDD12_07455 [Lewinella sp.]|nr:hypothetical protein [Lewinella sp.]